MRFLEEMHCGRKEEKKSSNLPGTSGASLSFVIERLPVQARVANSCAEWTGRTTPSQV